MQKLLVVLAILATHSAASAFINEIYYGDGSSYAITTSRADDRFWVDWERSEPWNPATQFSVTSGGEFAEVRAGGNSTITIDGGIMFGEQNILTDSAIFNLISGSIKNGMTAGAGTTINISGGLVQTRFTSTFNTSGTFQMTGGEIDHVYFHDNALGSVSGGTINDYIYVEDDSVVTLSGIFDQGYTTIVDDSSNGLCTTGLITGSLLDGTPINIEYTVCDQGRIVLVPEPGCMVLIALGVIGVSRKRH